MRMRLEFRIPTRVTTLLLLLTLAASSLFAQQRLTFAVAGDVGERGKPQLAISNQMNLYRRNGRPFQLVLLLGDNIYDDGIGKGFLEEFEKPFKALIDAGSEGMKKDQIENIRAGARLMLQGLARSDNDWKTVIHLPGKSGGRYRVR